MWLCCQIQTVHTLKMKNILISHDNLENGSAKSHLSLRASVHVISTGENTMIFTRPSRLHETASVMIYLPLKSTSPFPSVSNMSMTRCTRGFCWSSGRDMNSSTLSEPELSRSSFLNLFPNLLISSASTEMKQRERERRVIYRQTERKSETDRTHGLKFCLTGGGESLDQVCWPQRV